MTIRVRVMVMVMVMVRVRVMVIVRVRVRVRVINAAEPKVVCVLFYSKASAKADLKRNAVDNRS